MSPVYEKRATRAAFSKDPHDFGLKSSIHSVDFCTWAKAARLPFRVIRVRIATAADRAMWAVPRRRRFPEHQRLREAWTPNGVPNPLD